MTEEQNTPQAEQAKPEVMEPEQEQECNGETAVQTCKQQAIAMSEELDVKPFQATGFWAEWRRNAARIPEEARMTKQIAEFQSQRLEVAHKFLLDVYELFLKGKLADSAAPIRLHAKKLLDDYEVQINQSTQDHLARLDDNLAAALETLKGSALPDEVKHRRLEDTVVDYFIAVENIRTHKLDDE